MTQREPKLPVGRRDLLAATIAVWAVVGLVAVTRPWHRAYVATLIAEVVGISRDEGRVYALAMLLALFLAGFTLLARGELLRIPLLLCTAAAAGAVGVYLWNMHRARDTILGTLFEAGASLEGTVRVGVELGLGVYVATAAAALSLGTAVFALKSSPRLNPSLDGKAPSI